MPTEDRVRVLRVLEYEGPRSWVEHSMKLRAVKGEVVFGENRCTVREAILGDYPEILGKQEIKSDSEGK